MGDEVFHGFPNDGPRCIGRNAGDRELLTVHLRTEAEQDIRRQFNGMKQDMSGGLHHRL